MNRNILFVLCALVAISVAQKCKTMHPVILMPGIMGTVLYADGDFPTTLTLPEECPHKFTDQLIWIDVKQAINYKCFMNYFASNYNATSGAWERVEGITFTVPKWGSTYAVDQLAPNGITSTLVPYYHKMIEKFKSLGYVDGENLLGAGFDWKDLPTKEWIGKLKDLIEGAVKKSGEKAVLIVHSMGGPYSYHFLMQMGEKWVEKYIHMYIPMAPAWMGAVKALDMMLLGVDRNVPIAGKFFAPLIRHIPSIWFLLPWKEAFPNMTLATSPSKVYSYDDLRQLLKDGTAGYVDEKIDAATAFMKPYNNYEKAPNVPIRAYIGRGKNTVLGLNFKADIKPHDPDGVWESCSRVMGDGDGTVPLESATYATNKWMKQGVKDLKVYTYDDMGHLPIVKDADVIQSVIDQFCETK